MRTIAFVIILGVGLFTHAKSLIPPAPPPASLSRSARQLWNNLLAPEVLSAGAADHFRPPRSQPRRRLIFYTERETQALRELLSTAEFQQYVSDGEAYAQRMLNHYYALAASGEVGDYSFKLDWRTLFSAYRNRVSQDPELEPELRATLVHDLKRSVVDNLRTALRLHFRSRHENKDHLMLAEGDPTSGLAFKKMIYSDIYNLEMRWLAGSDRLFARSRGLTYQIFNARLQEPDQALSPLTLSPGSYPWSPQSVSLRWRTISEERLTKAQNIALEILYNELFPEAHQRLTSLITFLSYKDRSAEEVSDALAAFERPWDVQQSLMVPVARSGLSSFTGSRLRQRLESVRPLLGADGSFEQTQIWSSLWWWGEARRRGYWQERDLRARQLGLPYRGPQTFAPPFSIRQALRLCLNLFVKN